MKSKVYWAIVVLAAGGVASAIWLVVMNIRNSGFCPPIFAIPACYPVLLAFILVLLSTTPLKEPFSALLFYPGAFLGLTLAIWFSYNSMTGRGNCPEILGFPLCYLSFFVFLVLLMLRSSLKR